MTLAGLTRRASSSRFVGLAVASAFACNATIDVRLGAQSPALEAGVPIVRTIQPGDEHRYPVMFSSGQAGRFELDSDQALSFSITDPEGSTSLSSRDASEEIGTVCVTVLARVSGVHTVVLRVNDGEQGGRYALRFRGVHAATEADEQSAGAQALMREGIVLAKTTSRESRLAAVNRFKQSLELSRSANDHLLEVEAASQLGKVFNRLGEAPHAVEWYQRALDLFRASGDRRQQASTLNNIGLELRNLGKFAEAIDALGRSASLFHELNDKAGERSPHNNLGLTYLDLGELEKAQAEYEVSLALARETLFKRGQAYALSGLAAVANAEGRLQTGLDEMTQALEIWQELDDRQLVAQMLGNLAQISLRLGDPTSALDHLSRAREIQKLAPNVRLEATTLRNIADAYVQLHEPRKALPAANASLTFWRELGNHAEEAVGTAQIAEILEQEDRPSEAADAFVRAQSLAHDAGHRLAEIRALTGHSRVLLKQGAYAEASARAADALALARLSSLRVAEEQSLVALGRIEAARDDLNAARGHLENAIGLAESIRLSVAGSDRRTSFFVSVREKYDLLIDVLMRLDDRHPSDGFAARAFELSERARARGLLELLGESRANIREGIDPALLDRERKLRASIVGKTGASDETLQQTLQAYRELQDEIRARSPRYAALVEPQPVRLDDLRQGVLDGRTALVEYALGEERSYVWVITSSSFTSRRLPGRLQIETAARRAYDALTDPNASDARESLRALGRLLLDPIVDRLAADRVAVVTEGALQYIPFAALPDPAGRPLVLSHEIVNLPSASTLQVLRREIDGRAPAPHSLFVVGDPVFDSHDPRVRSSAREPRVVASAALERSAHESGLGSLERLYFTRVEAKSIAALAQNDPSSTLLDFEASLDRVKDGTVSGYRFVHFATHGLLNNRHPELSGLVFSLVDSRGRPRDGFLPAYDVYNLRLNADLVVLSACQTALGEDVRGEGLIGLTRGFMYAGAARVVSSLWRVPDSATAALMRRFYRGILVDHLAPAASLREAQRTVRANPRWSAPYYWAGFIIQGEWR